MNPLLLNKTLQRKPQDIKIFQDKTSSTDKKEKLPPSEGEVKAESSAKSRSWKHSEERTTLGLLKDQHRLVPSGEKCH